MISVEEKLGVFTQYLLRKQREWGKQTINTAKDKSRKKNAVSKNAVTTLFSVIRTKSSPRVKTLQKQSFWKKKAVFWRILNRRCWMKPEIMSAQKSTAVTL